MYKKGLIRIRIRFQVIYSDTNPSGFGKLIWILPDPERCYYVNLTDLWAGPLTALVDCLIIPTTEHEQAVTIPEPLQKKIHNAQRLTLRRLVAS